MLVGINGLELPKRAVYAADISGGLVTIGGVSENREDVLRLTHILGSLSVGAEVMFYAENQRYRARGLGKVQEYLFEDRSDETRSMLTYKLTIKADTETLG